MLFTLALEHTENLLEGKNYRHFCISEWFRFSSHKTVVEQLKSIQNSGHFDDGETSKNLASIFEVTCFFLLNASWAQF